MANMLLSLLVVLCLHASNALKIERIGTHIYADGTVRHNEFSMYPGGYAKINGQYYGNYPYYYSSSESALPPAVNFYPGYYQYPSNTQYQQQSSYQYQYPAAQQQSYYQNQYPATQQQSYYQNQYPAYQQQTSG